MPPNNETLVLYTLDKKPKLYTGDRAVWETMLAAAAPGSVVVKMQTTVKDMIDHGDSNVSCDLGTWMGEGFSIAAPIDPTDAFKSIGFAGSSVLAWGAYYPRTQRLRLTFNSGRQYDYAPVGDIVWDNLVDAALNGGSVGKLYNATVKGAYDCLFIADGVDPLFVPQFIPAPGPSPVTGDGGASPQQIPILYPQPGVMNALAGTDGAEEPAAAPPAAPVKPVVIDIPTGEEFDERLAAMRVSLKNASLLLEMQRAFKSVCRQARKLAGQ
jgi:KTSC domain-containing protein